ncbi:MAG: hypothetical protein KDB37_12830, partial [Ilumatobacter sp.]|nr:hypothetical protein [Ilumatobacter sp.]
PTPCRTHDACSASDETATSSERPAVQAHHRVVQGPACSRGPEEQEAGLRQEEQQEQEQEQQEGVQ